MNVCLKCGAAPTPDTADTELPMCFAHRLDGESDSGAPPDADVFAEPITEADIERLDADRRDDGMQEIRDAAFGDLGL